MQKFVYVIVAINYWNTCDNHIFVDYADTNHSNQLSTGNQHQLRSIIWDFVLK